MKAPPPQDGPLGPVVPVSTLVPHRDRRSPLQVWLCHSGGAESWWLVSARGREWRFPGHTQLEDVGAVLAGEQPHRNRRLELLEAAGHSVWLTPAEREAKVCDVAPTTEV